MHLTNCCWVADNLPTTEDNILRTIPQDNLVHLNSKQNNTPLVAVVDICNFKFKKSPQGILTKTSERERERAQSTRTNLIYMTTQVVSVSHSYSHRTG